MIYQREKEETLLKMLRFSLALRENESSNQFWRELNIERTWGDIVYIYNLLKEHSILPIFSDVIKYIPEEYAEVQKTWKEAVYSNIYAYTNLEKEQKKILDSFNVDNIPVVVVKGTSASMYYPKPHLRTMGDIDLLVRPEDFERAKDHLLEFGCVETTKVTEVKRKRHKSFFYEGVSIELHRYFSSRTNGEKASLFDDMLYEAISNKSTCLPNEENGLVLLSHIGQHLKSGLGLRQVIDWFMFVRTCLDDEIWCSSFQEKTRITGLEKLAIIVTRMCQIYLGLTTENITWCKEADEELCGILMRYVLECGNFGRSRNTFQRVVIEGLPPLYKPIQFFKHIQSHGETNWKVLKKHPYLKPFAWIYQSCRYIKLAVQNKVTPNKLKSIYDEGNKRNEMFAALGLR